jgi:anti-sigma factor RsiW
MSTDRTLKTDKELWQSLAIGPVASDAVSGAISDMDFAAWLEGNLSETEAARIDAAVAADPEMRRTAMDLSEILGMPLPAAPARMAVRAQALVGFEVERQQARRGWLAGLFEGFALPRAVMAAATVVVAISGFMLGGGLGESYAQEKQSVTAPAAQSSNELTSFFTADGI